VSGFSPSRYSEFSRCSSSEFSEATTGAADTFSTLLSAIQMRSAAAFSSVFVTPLKSPRGTINEPHYRPYRHRLHRPEPLYRPDVPEVLCPIPLASAQGMAYQQDTRPQEHGKEVMR
jgi:hypothetical protein